MSPAPSGTQKGLPLPLNTWHLGLPTLSCHLSSHQHLEPRAAPLQQAPPGQWHSAVTKTVLPVRLGACGLMNTVVWSGQCAPVTTCP